MTEGVDWMAARRKAWATRKAELREREPGRVEQRRRELLERERVRARKSFDSGHIAWSTLPETRVLTGWHVDEQGCRARTVGNES